MKKIIIPKEELHQKYIIENMSRGECASFFNVNETLIKSRIKEYGFVKTKEQKSEVLSRVQKILLDKNILYDLYIVQNMSLSECAEKLQTQPHTVKRRLRDFGIKKPQDKFKEIHKTHANVMENTSKKRKETNLKKFGVDNVSKIKEIQNKKNKTTQKHYGVNNPFQAQIIRNLISNKVMEKYGVPYACMREECRKYSGNNSKPNQIFSELLDKYKISYLREFPIDNYSYDFKVGNYLFEIDPTIFHNSTFAPVGLLKDKNYHFNKTSVAKEYGYHCVHVFDWDDKEKVIRLFLEEKERIFARNCVVKEVSKKETIDFLSNNHLQGYAKDTVRIGLYEKGTDLLVAIMTFSEPRYNNNFQYELIRFCSIKNVVGGAQKIFKNFVEKYKPKSIISYCDLSKFDGKIYLNLDFKVINKPRPSKHWVNLKTNQHITDNLLRQKGFDQLFKTNYGKGTSNEKLMLENNFVEVFDCGQLTFVWNNK